MDMRVYLGKASADWDLEVDPEDPYVKQILVEILGSKLEWLSLNYPDLPILKREVPDISAQLIIHEWYVDFRDTEGFVHYKLTYGYEKEP